MFGLKATVKFINTHKKTLKSRTLWDTLYGILGKKLVKKLTLVMS